MSPEKNSASFTDQGIPTHQELVIPALQAVASLGGSTESGEIVDYVIEHYPNSESLLEITYPKRPSVAVLPERVAWARSMAKLIGALEQPTRGMYLITKLGEGLLQLPEEKALEKVRDLDRDYYRQQRQRKLSDSAQNSSRQIEDSQPSAEVLADTESDKAATGSEWKAQLLDRLHRLSPEGFEKFVLYLLRRYGLQLTHMGGSGDEGIDGIGTAPLSPVLSSRVAVQVKRYAPQGKPIGRETVALFQRDAQTKGAERAILVTLSRFTEAARKAANAASPTVDLINGDRLAELIRDDGESGVTLQPTVSETWFERFD